MRVLLVNTNRARLPDPIAPIGLATVAAGVIAAGYEVEACDLCFADDPLASLRAHVQRFAPDIVGITIRNIDNTAFPHSESYVPFVAQVVKAARQECDVPFVLGGSGFSLLPDAMLERLEVDLGIVGEGEHALAQLLAALQDGTAPESVAGVVVRRPTVAGPRTRSSAGFRLQTPGYRKTRGCAIMKPEARSLKPGPGDFPGTMVPNGPRAWQLFDLQRYFRDGGMIPIQTKRGCAFACEYCTYPQLEGAQIRAREPGAVVDEIERHVKDDRIDHFFFVDSVFNVPERHAAAILEEIIRRGLRIGWTAYVTPRSPNVELIGLMARSGCSGIELGIDGGAEATLASLRKGFSVDDIRTFARLAKAARLRTCCSLIFGAPDESAATLDQSFALMDEIAPDAVIAMVGVRIYPQSGLWRAALRSGQISPDADPLDPVFYLSEKLDKSDLQSIVARATARPEWILPGYRLREDEHLFAQLRERKIKGPLWRLVRANS